MTVFWFLQKGHEKTVVNDLPSFGCDPIFSQKRTESRANLVYFEDILSY